MVEQLPRMYADVCEQKPEDYSNYQVHDIKFGWERLYFSQQDDYEILRKLGRGKYSEVYEGVNIVTS